MGRNRRTIVSAIAALLVAAAVGQAADVNKAIGDAEGRKRAAENGLKEIKAKAQPSDQVRSAYIEAATRQNAWLEAVCQAVEQGAPAAPDVSAPAQSAAASLVEWVNIRNRTLGLAELTAPAADSTKKSVAGDLIEIANATWKSNRSGDAKKRSAAANALKERLRWKPFEEV